ncbi:MAG: LCP family protein [Patescibacteria group bacterium]|nr:LCP family protein [Patescibacteria group bacterium]
MNSKTKIFSLLFLSVIIILVGAFLLSYQKKIFVFLGAEPAINENRTTFLLFGKTGKIIGWNMAPDLTDSIILVDYRPKIGAMNLVSLPRDLYINVDGDKFKLNEVAKRNKIDGFLKQLPEITGLSTDKYIVVDVDILKMVVDNLGGIDMNLSSPAIDRASGFTMEAGNRHLSGDQTIWLVRNRYAPEGDFFREKNQHQIIQAIIDKFKKMSYLSKTRFIFKMAPELGKLDTNINFQEIIPMAEKLSNPRFNDIVLDFNIGLLESKSELINASSSAYILVPKAGEGDYNEIRNYIQNRLER